VAAEQQANMRRAMLATSASLSRLLERMHNLSHRARESPTGIIIRAEDANWTVGDLEPKSPLLAGLQNIKLSPATSRVLQVHVRLLSALASGDEIDPLWVCRVLLALGDDYAHDYPPAVARMAELAGAKLPANPRDLHHGLGLREFTFPGEWRPSTPKKLSSP
jgi:hypothetical protein